MLSFNKVNNGQTSFLSLKSGNSFNQANQSIIFEIESQYL